MKKFLIYTGSFVLLIVILWIIGNATKTFTRYRSESSANEPTIKQGTGFFVSSLKKPERFDFICVEAETQDMGKAMVIFRLCGLAGDIIEIKNGDLFVNNVFADSSLSISHSYMVTGDEIQNHEFEKIDPSHIMLGPDTLRFNSTEAYVKNNIPKAIRVNLQPSEKQPHIAKLFGKDWNTDHFGPVTVPADHYFILGDNRSNALDSRYLGFIPTKNFVATVLWKK